MEVDIDLSKTEETLDRLITKAEKLRSILAETLEMDKKFPDKDTSNSGLPTIVYNVSLGNLKDIMNAPNEAFSEAFLDEIAKAFTQIANMSVITPEQIAENKKKLAEQHIQRQKSKHN
jgi:hypothetical protein